MTFDQLRQQYTADELSYFPGNSKLRYKAFAPILSDLHENKVIYCEKFICVAQLEDIEISEPGFGATAIPLLPIDRNGNFRPKTPDRKWHFRGTWEFMMLINNAINALYAGWSIWSEKDRVRKVEALVRNGNMKGALELTLHGSKAPD